MTASAHSGRYTHGHEASTMAAHGSRTAASSAGYLLPHLTPGMAVLDVGCGPGSITLDLARLVSPGRVVGLEAAEAPLVAARALAAERAETTTEFILGDVYDLPYPDGFFDVVHAHQVLQHLTDPVAALREMARVTRPGGLLAARDGDYAAFAWYPELPGLERWRTTYRAVARANGAEPDAGRHMRAWTRAAGLDDVTITTTAWQYADAASCTRWGGSWANRVLGDVFLGQAAEQGVPRDEVEAMADAWRAWAADPDAWFLVPHVELLARVTG